MMGKLYVVGTPIGNLGDFSPRGARALAECDFIAAEDTRVTAKLLHHFELSKPMLSYHEHNRRICGEKILARLLAGETCALVTDAGMPAISDPGEDLVALCHNSGIAVEAVPGPTAFATALAISGFPSGRFTFEGFLSVNKRSRKEHLDSLAGETRTMLFYEAPHKLPGTLRDFAQRFGQRPLAIVRELTKVHEEVIRTTCEEAAKKYANDPPAAHNPKQISAHPTSAHNPKQISANPTSAHNPKQIFDHPTSAHNPKQISANPTSAHLKGEIVLVLAGAEPNVQETMPLEEGCALAREYVAEGMQKSEAARRAAKETGLRRNEIYAAMMERCV